MAFDTPQAQQDVTPTPAPTPTPAATPAPDQNTGAEPSPQTVQGPATAPAGALPPSKTGGVHGVLGGILMGALAGAHAAVKGFGSGLKKAAPYIPVAAAARRKAIETNDMDQDAQQNLKLKQQKADQEATKSLDDHQKSVVETNNATLTNHNLLEEAQDRDAARIAAQVDMARQFTNFLHEQGIDLDSEHGAGHSGLTNQDAQDVAKGNTVHIFNGQTGQDSAGVGIMNTASLNQPLTQDVKVPMKMGINPTTGKLEATDYQTIKADGRNTIGTVFSNFSDVQRMGVQAQSEFDQQQKNLQAQAKTKKDQEDKAEATPKTQEELSIALADANQALSKDPKNPQLIAARDKIKAESNQAVADAKAIAAAKSEGGEGAAVVTDANKALTGDAFIQTLPLPMQDLVRSITKYNSDSKDLPRGKEKLPLMEAAFHADPTFSEAKYNERYDYLKEYGSSKSGDGATRHRLNTAVGHLDMLAQANQALLQNDIPTLNKIANTIGVQAGSSAKTMYDAIARKAASEAAGAMKGGSTSPTDPEIETTFKSFDSNQGAQQRMDNIKTQFGLLATQVGTINGAFQTTMGRSPDEFGQPVLYGGNQQIMNKWITGGGQTQQVPPGGTPILRNGQPVGYVLNGKRVNF
jgi:hypothetical protein